MKRLPAILLIVAAILIATSCGDGSPHVISVKKMSEIMADIHTGESVVETNGITYRDDSVKRALMQSICARHGVTVADLDTSLYWYGNHLDDYVKVYDRTIEILKNRIADAEKSGGKSATAAVIISPDGDSVNIWRGPTFRRNTSLSPTDFISFNFASEKNWERGDRYTLSARPINPRSPMTLTLCVSYNDGTGEYVTLSTPVEGTRRLTLVLDSSKVATNLFGTINYHAYPSEVSYIDSISLVRTRGRDNNKQARARQQTVKLR